MPLIPTAGIENTNTQLIEVLEHEIIRILDIAALLPHNYRDLSKKWFGDDRGIWLAELRTKLERLTHLIRYHNIYISHILDQAQDSRTLSEAVTAYLQAKKDYTSNDNYCDIMSLPQPKSFYIDVGNIWLTEPLYCHGFNPASKFKTLFKEIIHVLLGALDNKYQYARCVSLAEVNNAQAKRNADNWGYFLQSCRIAYYSQYQTSAPDLAPNLEGACSIAPAIHANGIDVHGVAAERDMTQYQITPANSLWEVAAALDITQHEDEYYRWSIQGQDPTLSQWQLDLVGAVTRSHCPPPYSPPSPPQSTQQGLNNTRTVKRTDAVRDSKNAVHEATNAAIRYYSK